MISITAERFGELLAAETKLAEVLKIGPTLAEEEGALGPWNKGWNAAIRAVRAVARGEGDRG